MEIELPLFVGLGTIAVGEILLTLAWTPAYFQVGIPIYRRTRHTAPAGSMLPVAEAIERELPRDPYPEFLVRDLGSGAYAFREKSFSTSGRSYTPVMRGLLTFDPRRGELSVTGHVNWVVPAFLVVATVFILNLAPSDSAALLMSVPMIGVPSWIYVIQKRRFSDVADTVADLWGRS